MRSIRRLTRLLTFSALTAGCYTLQPAVGVVPEIGSQVAFDVTDAGRYALGGSMGPEIAQIEGRLVDKSGADYLVAVSSVRLLRGGHQIWSGERVRINATHVGTPHIRKFSRARTAVLGAVVLGGFAAYMASRGLSIFGSGRSNPPDTTIDAIIIRP